MGSARIVESINSRMPLTVLELIDRSIASEGQDCLYISLQKQSAEVFHKKGVVKNFSKLTRKNLSQNLFSCEFCKVFKNTFLTEHLWTNASVNRNLAQIRI